MDSHCHTGMSNLIYLCFKREISTVGKSISIAFPMIFFCISVTEDYKWIVMMLSRHTKLKFIKKSIYYVEK